MRETLFRGKYANSGKYTGGEYPDTGDWVYGDLIHFGEDAGRPSIHADSGHGWYGNYVVDPDTVGEYTGLTDWDGVEIYEGDIVVDVPLPTRLNPRALKKGVVKFGTYRNSSEDMIEAQGFYIEWLNDELELSQKSLPYWAESVSVCGNIHDNPELLTPSVETGGNGNENETA